jgi:tripartite-type tricarboxylate transporter receptor subunit TctC
MKTLLAATFGAIACILSPGIGAQAAFPERPVHLIVGFPAGSQPDIVARLLAQQLEGTLGNPVIVDNVTGAAGNIAADRVAKGAPDGHTVGLLSQTHLAVNPSLYKLPYDALRDFAPVSQVVSSPALLVVPASLSPRNLAELVALAKARPGELTFASSGTGTGTHMAAELFKSTAGIDLRHVPYRGVVAALPDVVSGRVSMMFSPIPVVLPLVRQGELRALAVTSLRRSTAVPDIPTVAESGYPEFEATNWYGVVAPAGTPASIVLKLHAATIAALASPELRTRLDGLGMQVIGNSPDEFAAAIRREIPQWAAVIERAGIKRH